MTQCPNCGQRIIDLKEFKEEMRFCFGKFTEDVEHFAKSLSPEIAAADHEGTWWCRFLEFLLTQERIDVFDLMRQVSMAIKSGNVGNEQARTLLKKQLGDLMGTMAENSEDLLGRGRKKNKEVFH